MKLSIDMTMAGIPAPSEDLEQVSLGCIRLVAKLKNRARLVEAIRVHWECFDGRGYGPVFTFHLVTKVGVEGKYSVDFRSMGKKDGKPTAEEIVGYLSSPHQLPMTLQSHGVKCLAAAQQIIASIPTD